jgi:ribokinase
MSTVCLLGDLNVDVLLPVAAYPPPGGETVAGRVETTAGGSSANTAGVLGRLGAGARLIGRVGRDRWAEAALEPLRAAGVDTRWLQVDGEAGTGLTFIAVGPAGERTMFAYRGANTRTDPDEIRAEVFAGAAALHVSGYALLTAPQSQAAERALSLAHAAGVPLSLDPGELPARERMAEVQAWLPRLGLCVLGREEARSLAGTAEPLAAAERLVGLGVRWVGLKLGAAGALVADAAGAWHIPALPVTAVDTTGCGDAFSAGMLFGLARGLSLPAAGWLATTLGGLAATVPGAGPALPGREAALPALRQRLAEAAPEHRSWAEEALTALDNPAS